MDPADNLSLGEPTISLQPCLEEQPNKTTNLSLEKNAIDPGRKIWTSTCQVTCEDSFPVVHMWLRRCRSPEHEQCLWPAQRLPTRLIAISQDPKSKTVTARLQEFDESQFGDYVALSHCWGKADSYPSFKNRTILKTTRDNYKQHLAAIPIDHDAMPLNFKDAIYVTLELGFQYIWIDSLCIIQHDQKDWEEQSVRMADVFGSAQVTIAATSATHCRQGFLGPRQPAYHLLLPHLGTEPTLARLSSSESQSLNSEPLFSRGWTFQELMLSRRIIHFTHDQLFWKCQSSLESEDSLVQATQSSTLFNLSTPEFARRSWWTWVADYSKRELTYLSDRHAAMASLTKNYSSKMHMTSHAGLWLEDLHFGLLWCVRAADSSDTTTEDSTLKPSWSWFSHTRGVRHLAAAHTTRWADHDARTWLAASIISTPVRWSNVELLSTIDDANLMIRARVKEVYLCRDHRNYQALIAQGKASGSRLASHDFADPWLFIWPHHRVDFRRPPEVPWIGECALDDVVPELDPIFQGFKATAVELSIYGGCAMREHDITKQYTACREYNHCRRDVLVVVPTGKTPREYKRIGAGDMTAWLGNNGGTHRHEDYFHDASLVDLVRV